LKALLERARVQMPPIVPAPTTLTELQPASAAARPSEQERADQRSAPESAPRKFEQNDAPLRATSTQNPLHPDRARNPDGDQNVAIPPWVPVLAVSGVLMILGFLRGRYGRFGKAEEHA
jgi:hypothetical protein